MRSRPDLGQRGLYNGQEVRIRARAERAHPAAIERFQRVRFEQLGRPGLWEITSTMEMSGMNMKMPSYTFQHCYTPTEVSDAKKIVPKDQNNKCRTTGVTQSGNTVSWKMICTGKQAMTGSGTITFGNNSYSGTTQMSMAGEGGASR